MLSITRNRITLLIEVSLLVMKLQHFGTFSTPISNMFPENYEQRHTRSQIFSRSLFSRTIRTSPALSSLVNKASFEWIVDIDDDVDNRIMFDIPEHLPPSLEQLHLSSIKHIPDSLDGMLLITSLGIKSSMLQNDIHDRRVPRDELFNVFSLPRLDRLSILWDDSESSMVYTSDSVNRAYTSSVTVLSFYAALPRANDLAEILSWPKKLKSLNIMMRCKGIPQSWNDEDWKDIHTLEVVKVLETQSQHLEELCLSGQSITNGDSVDLTQFTALRRLDLVQGDRMFFHRPDGPRSIMTLSPGLEVLRVDFLYRRTWISFLKKSRGPFEEPIYIWLRDLAVNSSQHPKLRRVILDNMFGDDKKYGHKRYLILVTKALLDAFERTGVELTLGRTQSPMWI